MTALALRGRDSTAVRGEALPMPRIGQARPDGGEWHPDVLAVARDMGVTHPRTLAQLQALYDRAVANADADFDFGGHVLTRLTRGGSKPVDNAVGERVASRLAGAQ